MSSKWERWIPLSGVAFVVLFLVGYFLPGDPPSIQASGDQWAAWFNAHHRTILMGLLLVTAGFAAFISFVSVLAATLRRAGEDRLAAVVFGGAMATISFAAVAVTAQAAAAYRIRSEFRPLTKAFVELSYVAQTIVGVPISVLMGGAAVAALRSGVLPAWYGGASAVAALVMFTSAGALSYKGFYSPDGAYAYISLIVFLVWTLLTAALLTRLAAGEEVPAAAAAPAA